MAEKFKMFAVLLSGGLIKHRKKIADALGLAKASPGAKVFCEGKQIYPYEIPPNIELALAHVACSSPSIACSQP